MSQALMLARALVKPATSPKTRRLKGMGAFNGNPILLGDNSNLATRLRFAVVRANQSRLELLFEPIRLVPDVERHGVMQEPRRDTVAITRSPNTATPIGWCGVRARRESSRLPSGSALAIYVAGSRSHQLFSL